MASSTPGLFSSGCRRAFPPRQLATNQTGVFKGYAVPAVAVTDQLRSWELGLKGDFPAKHLRLNATVYATRIENLQVSRYDPSNVACLIFVENAGDAASRGVDADFEWAASRRLTIGGAFSWLRTELVRGNPQLDDIVVPVGSELPLARASPATCAPATPSPWVPSGRKPTFERSSTTAAAAFSAWSAAPS